MKKVLVIVADTDEDFRNMTNSLYDPGKLDVRFYSAAMDVLPLFKTEEPALVFLSLDLPDVNDFVMHDFLKKAKGSKGAIPVYLLYTQNSESDLKKYQKLKYQADDFFKKPVEKDIIDALLAKCSEIAVPVEETLPGIDAIEDEDEFSDENIDRLVRGDLVDMALADDKAESSDRMPAFEETGQKERDKTNELLSGNASEPMSETKTELDVNLQDDDEFEVDLDIDIGLGNKKKSKKGDKKPGKDLEVQLIALESQNEFLRSESKKYSDTAKKLEKELKSSKEDIKRLKSELSVKESAYNDLKSNEANEKTGLHGKIEALQGVMTGLEAKNTELTTQLEGQRREFSQQTESMKEEFDRKEEGYRQDTQKLESEKHELQQQVSELNNRLTDKERELVARNHQFEKDLKNKLDEVLQETEDRLSSEFAKEKDLLAQHIRGLQEERSSLEATLNAKVEELTDSCSQLESEKNELKKREEALNRAVSTMAEEKITLSDTVASLKENLAGREQEIKEKEAANQSQLQELNGELDVVKNSLDFYMKRMEELGQLLHNGVLLTQPE